ncbi:MAG: Prolyl-tRNA synthetase [Candidatus Giovannonibacteria bacterium GW2011_GWA2_44_13b]|uniref:Proline--tRNA ligase n=2 Tax=Candidatus Giovannoniibacteriota TaxID=1752738 RepID=A0A0G1JE78_9BACT|nr:MAG: Prolyl-tRNA synthetase [Candidatus Giovannonibacteria bacterium GW2011_GWA2_44_13b]OGF83235.1 MAG: hypothetical protein A2924_02880 [Candidatus Giovannonibacteria bacterium RIFCSPLOWO2_01_FULL_44_16]
MLQSQLFTKIEKTPPRDEESLNAKLLVQAGFVQKLMAGVYTFLPLGLRVLNKIENIVREEMNKAGAVEILMPSLQPKENWEATKRWDTFDALLKTKSKFSGEFALGPTHEEVIYPLLKNHLSSYRDLPVSVYQIQTKFRDEKRAKSGLLRGREFRMKDCYSYHASDEDRDKYYDVMKNSYMNIFKRLELDAIPTNAGGGTFSELSMEFQVSCAAGEDIIYLCEKCRIAVNKELADNSVVNCPNCKGPTKEEKSIEVGNIFPLKETYAKDFGLTFKDNKGEMKIVSAGCYGLGTSRVMGAIAETHNDENGLRWPKSVAPYDIHLVYLKSNDKNVKAEAEKLYHKCLKAGAEILFDDREDVTAGAKFAESDLIGIPLRVVMSDRTLEKNSAELKARNKKENKLIKISDLYSYIRND